MLRFTSILPLALALAACAAIPEPPPPVAPQHREAHALAQAACAGCHSVEAYGLSPNRDAPEWPLIANSEGLTRESLTTWLRAAHNYPEQMDFYLDEEEVQLLADYMLTLRRDDYHPPY